MLYKLVEISPPMPAVEASLEQTNLGTIISEADEDYQEYADIIEHEVAQGLLKDSRLYNAMITIPVTRGKGKKLSVKKRLIDLLVSRSGDLVEAVSPKVFRHLNGNQPSQPNIIQHHILGKNYNEGKVDIYTACDGLYSELGFNSCQDMLNEVEQLKELSRSVK